MDQDTWKEIMRVAHECKRAWGMGFPVISTHLLNEILEGKKVKRADVPSRPSDYLARD